MADQRGTPPGLRGLRTWAAAIRHWRVEGAETLASHGLTWSGFEVLLELLRGPLRSGEICSKLAMTTGGMAKLLKRLEASGVIVRIRGEEDDLRTVIVEITPAGRDLVEAAGADVVAMRDFDYRQWNISPESQQALDQVWSRLGSGSNGDRPSGSPAT